MRFLIVESYAETKLHIQRAVASMGHEMTVCEEGSLGWETYQAEHYPVVILDQILPDMEGTELCRRIHSQHRQAATVVLLVVACGPKDAMELLDCGADDFLFLPLHSDRLKLRLAFAERLARERLANNRADQTTGALVKAVEIMHVGVTISDIEGRILYTNVAEARMHGYEPYELEGQNVRLFSPSSNWKWMTRDEMKQIKGWKRQSVNVRKDGTTFPVQLTSDVVFDPSGDPIGIVTTSEDISHIVNTFLRSAG